MFRPILGALGLLFVLVPDRLVEATERWATGTPDVSELRSWVVPAVRLEGALYVLLAWRGGVGYSAFKQFLGGIGLLALASPERFVDAGTRLAYENPEECRWKSWVYALTRVLGLAYLLLAIDEFRRNRSSTE